MRTPWAIRQPAFWWGFLSFSLMVVGGFAPWATIFGFADVSGTRGDGWFVILGGVLGAVLLVTHANRYPSKRWLPILGALVGSVGAVVAAIDLSDIGSVADTGLGDLVDPAWGIYVSLL